MDQLKPILLVLKKHLFWIVCGIVTLLSLGILLVTSASVSSKLSSRKSMIGSVFGHHSTILSKANHPNQTSDSAMTQQADAIKKEVVDAWKEQVQYQQNILVWPKNIKGLGVSFRQRVEKLQPIELTVDYPIPESQEIPEQYRYAYRAFISEALPELATTLDAVWIDDKDPNPQFTVEWKQQNQLYVKDLFMWSAATLPSTLEILYAQENLWVLQEIMRIIAATNGEVDGRHKATIKRLDGLLLGKEVTVSGMQGTLGGVASAGGGGEGGFGGDDDDFGGDEGGLVTGVAPAAPDPADMRYVDDDFEGISAEDLRSRMRSKNPEDAYVAVAKRIPIRLQVLIDQRKISRFIAECGNADLPVEIRQVRLNRKAAGGAGAGGSGFGGGDDEGGDDEGDDGGDEGGGMEEGIVGGPGQLSDESPYDIEVEFLGIVYIYNPVDTERLGLDKIDELAKANLDADAAAEPPAEADGTGTAPAPAPPADGNATDPATTTPAATAGTPPVPVTN